MKKYLNKIPTLSLGIMIGIAVSSATVVGAATYLKATQTNINLVVNGKPAILSEKPITVNNRLYLPVRDTATAMGYSVSSVTSSKVELKQDNTTITNGDNNTSTNNTSKSPENTTAATFIKDLESTYATDGKLDPLKLKEGINSGAITVNTQDEQTGDSLLQIVIKENNYSAYQVIKTSKLNVNLQNKLGQTALHTAVIEQNRFYLGQLTGELKADAKVKDSSGKLAIDYATDSSIKSDLQGYML